MLLPIAVGFVFIMTGISQAAPYAVLINGGYDKYNNNIAFYNDLSTIYGTLIDDYGYLEENVYVLNSDGLNSGDDRNTVIDFDTDPWTYSYDSSPFDFTDYAATIDDIQTVFSTLSTKMTSQDSLFVWTTDHGGTQGGMDTGLWLWEGSFLTDDVFAAEVNKISNYAYEFFSFQQCYSGGFIDDLANSNRVIMSAASAYESAWYYVNEHGEYNYEFNNAVSGLGDMNGDGYVSMLETYNYVLLNDDFAVGVDRDKDGIIDTWEHPQYWDLSGIGDMITLNGVIPEPGTMILLGSLVAGLFGAAAVRKRQ